jgi:hypothetical protein
MVIANFPLSALRVAGGEQLFLARSPATGTGRWNAEKALLRVIEKATESEKTLS